MNLKMSLIMLSRLNFKRHNCTATFGSVSDGCKQTFSELYNLPSQVVDNMTKLGLIYPTEIQRKSLGSLLGVPQERCTVINAETGSGKTLCFLLPILKMFGEMWQREGSIPCGSAAILVPSPHLAQQVNDVYRSLAHPEWNCSVAAFHHSSFSYTKYSHLLVAVPGKLKHYSLDTLFNNNKILCLDEADTLLIGGEGLITKTILKKVQSTHRILQQRNDDSKRVQVRKDECTNDDGSSAVDVVRHRPNIIMTAATLPSKGPQTVGKQIMSLMPKVVIFKTDTTHKILPNVDLRFVPCGDFVSKFQQLEGDLDILKVDGQDLPKVLVFTNTKESAKEVTDFLRGGYQTKSQPQGIPSPKWWFGRVGSFYNQPGVFSEERESVVKAFRKGLLRVLVCSDLGSRGLDFPDCSAVIQFDFPENSEFFLHRAGRTARAGKAGLVISYVSESDQDIADEIQKVVESTSMSFDSLFSRNKMFRRKIKRRRNVSESI